MLFSAALYHTLNPSYITGLIPRPPHSFPEGPSGSDEFDDPWHQYGHEHPPNATPEEWRARAEQVKQAFLHAYHGYEQYAAPHDELKPLTNRSIDNFNGWGVTVFDSLDTMLLMDLKEEFTRAMAIVRNSTFTMPINIPSTDARDKPRKVYAPFFETVIRYLGGLLSAYALSHDTVLLDKAENLGRLLSPAFGTESGLPYFGVNTVTGLTNGGAVGILAEAASCQLEYAYLAKATGQKEFYEKSANIMRALEKVDLSKLGMFPKTFNLESGTPLDEVLSVGGAADSAHEYLLKLYLLTTQSDKAALDLYIQTTTRIISTLIYITPKRGLLYVTDTANSASWPSPSRKFEHLSCFLPGLLTLGVHTLPASAFQVPYTNFVGASAELLHYDLREMHMLAAEGIAESCWIMYADQPSELGPEEAIMRQGVTWLEQLKRWRESGGQGAMPGTQRQKPVRVPGIEARDYALRRTSHLLRPETIESMYLMWKTTGDTRWRDRAWGIFEALEREAKTEAGYAVLGNVEHSLGPKQDGMPSYFLAETLKYLYLMFHEEDLVPLDRWVFNTEAHPLPVFAWSPEERSKFGIADTDV
ncbi:hypothetical protein EIP86_005538 [Pleurotus ostreatoroseus]|nr:hypothetical protein EIP86_005538 [Pleurotus ostreatoroseus]